MMWLCGSEKNLNISIAVGIQYMNVRDGQTTTDGLYHALRIASRDKKKPIHSWRPLAVALLEVEFHAAITMHGKTHSADT